MNDCYHDYVLTSGYPEWLGTWFCIKCGDIRQGGKFIAEQVLQAKPRVLGGHSND